jgi:hypothetical protein
LPSFSAPRRFSLLSFRCYAIFIIDITPLDAISLAIFRQAPLPPLAGSAAARAMLPIIDYFRLFLRRVLVTAPFCHAMPFLADASPFSRFSFS